MFSVHHLLATASRNVSRNDMQKVLSLFADPLFVVRNSDACVLYCNNAAGTYFPHLSTGCYAADMLSKDSQRLFRGGQRAKVTTVPLYWNGFDPATLTVISRPTSSAAFSASAQPRAGLCSRIMEINLDNGEYLLEGISACTDFPELAEIRNVHELYHFLLHKAHPQDKGIIHNFLNLEALRNLHDIGTPRFTCRYRLRSCTGLYVPLKCRAVFRQSEEGGARAVLIIRSMADGLYRQGKEPQPF